MFSILAGLIYLAAIALPIWLLYHFHSTAWYWHVLALIVAVGIAVAPGTALLETVVGTFLYGFVFFTLAVWGIGGLLPFRWRRRTV